MAVENAREKRTLQVRAEYLAEMRKKAGMTQAEVAEAMGVSQQRVSAIESGAVAELATLADYVLALGQTVTESPTGTMAYGTPASPSSPRKLAAKFCPSSLSSSSWIWMARVGRTART